MPNELASYMLRLLLQKGSIYVGLSTLNLPESEIPTLAMLTATEPWTYLGYKRHEMNLDQWKTSEAKADGIEIFFRNADERPWPPIRTVFCATTRDATGILLAQSKLKAPRILFNGDTLTVTPTLQIEG